MSRVDEKYYNKYSQTQRSRRKTSKAKLIEKATPAERKLIAYLDKAGIKYIFNYVVRSSDALSGYYVVDFYFPKHKIFLELDGAVHKRQKNIWNDKLRSEDIHKAMPWVKQYRAWNSEVDDPSTLINKIGIKIRR